MLRKFSLQYLSSASIAVCSSVADAAMRAKSSANCRYFKKKVPHETPSCGRHSGRSETKRQKSIGERQQPCGRPMDDSKDSMR